MKFFGKFEKDNENRIYRTNTFLCLAGNSKLVEPAHTQIIGTIFMLNPGDAKPLGSTSNEPFKNYIFHQYTELEEDRTMLVLMGTFQKLQEQNKYLNGVIEIKNLFNYRESNSKKIDWPFINKEIQQNINPLNINSTPTFYGDFIFFAWGTSTLKTKEIQEYSKRIFTKSLNDNKHILYISPNNKESSEKKLSFYHPLGGHWNIDKKERFNNSISFSFECLNPITNFK